MAIRALHVQLTSETFKKLDKIKEYYKKEQGLTHVTNVTIITKLINDYEKKIIDDEKKEGM